MTDDTSGGDFEFERLFRSESVVSDVDLRVDVAGEVSQFLEQESISLADRSVHVRGDYMISRGSRSRTIDGTYERTVEETDTLAVGSAVEERVTGGVDVNMQVEDEAIMAGAYVNTVAGAYLRMTAWADFLVWGGWLEADLTRIEISGVAIRSYMGYCHIAGLRLLIARELVDDYVNRTEIFGTFVDATTGEKNLWSPGSGEMLET